MSDELRHPADELGRLARGLGAALRRLEHRGRRRVVAPAERVGTVATAASPNRVPADPTRVGTRPGADSSRSPAEHAAGAPPARSATPTPAAPNPRRSAPASAPPPRPSLLEGASDEALATTRRLASEAPDLATLKRTVAGCRACGLCETRTQTVFADGEAGGTRPARVMFVGEAPGQHEDEQGVPFVGRAGQLLTDIIEKGMGLRRAEVYIANVLKCRPPGNRDPEPLEKALCTPYLDRQIELVAPEVILPLGLHAARHLLESEDSMGRLRGRVHRRHGVAVVPTYHPAFLLRSPSMKKECWKDVQVAMGLLGLERPGR